MKQYQFVLWSEIMDYVKVLHDGVYNGRYNAEPALIRVEDGEPAWVQFIGNSSIFSQKGILLSNVELLLATK